MQTIIEFAKTATPIALLAIALIIILLLLLSDNSPISKLLNRIFRRQQLMEYKNEGTKVTLQSLDKKLELITGNHLHELPDMKVTLDSIKMAVDGITAKQNKDSERIARIEGKIGL